MPTARGSPAAAVPTPALDLPALQHHFTDLVTDSRLPRTLRARLRHLPAADRDDRVAEGLGVAWRAFLNKARREGVLLEARHLAWIAHRHARDTRLRLVGGDDARCPLAPQHRQSWSCYQELLERQRSRQVPCEVREEARRYLARATPDERRLLALHVEGHSFTELGQHLGVNRATACRRLRRTFAELRRRAART